MIRSMTGFGIKTIDWKNSQLTIEIKTLNSKQIDIYYRAFSAISEKEFDIRNLIGNVLQRGKVNVQISQKKLGTQPSTEINRAIAQSYMTDLKLLAKESGIGTDGLFSAILQLPDVIMSKEQLIEEEELKTLFEGINEVVDMVDEYRLTEGKSLDTELRTHIENISKLLLDVDEYEEERVSKIRGKIQSELTNLGSTSYDKNRFEEELIYYLEKIDVREEKVRLKHNLEHFTNCMNEEGPHGKKLNFIGQEIGREINTLGSKANHHKIQFIVVQMKDELEKIKEQVLNIL